MTVTMPDERLRALGEMRNFLREISDPSSQLSNLSLQLPERFTSKARRVLSYYPTFAQMAEEVLSDKSQERWLREFWPDSDETKKYQLGLFTKSRFRGLNDAGKLIADIAEDPGVQASIDFKDLLLTIKYVRRHYPNEWQLNNAGRSDQLLRYWINFESIPDWWVDPPEPLTIKEPSSKKAAKPTLDQYAGVRRARGFR